MFSQTALDLPVASDPAHLEALFYSEKAMARGLAAHWVAADRLHKARAFCAALIAAYWQSEKQRLGRAFPLSTPPSNPADLNNSERGLAQDMGARIARFSHEEACYLVGTIYTALLPAGMRAQLGAYYTPPGLVARLMDKAGDAGFDWVTGSALDPACGGGALYASASRRMPSLLATAWSTMRSG